MMNDELIYGIDIETIDGVVIEQGEHSVNSTLNADIEAPITQETQYSFDEAAKDVSTVETAERYLAKKRDHLGVKAKRTISNTIIYVILIAMTIIWLLPFVGIVLESFRCESTWQVGYLWPKQWGFDNYVRLFSSDMKFGRWLLNTFIIGVATSILQTVIILCVSYTLSRIRFKGRKGIMNFMLILGMFPGFLTLILLYKFLTGPNPESPLFTNGNSIFGLILVYIGSSGMGYYISKGYFDTIPKSLDEAARVDGATRAQVLWKVILPMAKPIVIYTVLMGFMAPWGDFVLASYIAHNTSDGYNVAVGLQNLIGTTSSLNANYTTFCAGGVIVAIPITTLFLCMQKYYVEGVTGGAVKG